MNQKKLSTTFLTEAAIIAALYTVLVIIFQFSSFGPIQFRIAEALTVLPYFTAAAIPGVTIGCILSGYLSGAAVLDIVFGSLASLIAAVLSYLLRRYKFLVPIPPIVINAIVIPWVLRFAYGEVQPIPLLTLSIGAGEFVSAGIIGIILLLALDRVKHVIFRTK
jgi:uncharacterized membrane protein